MPAGLAHRSLPRRIIEAEQAGTEVLVSSPAHAVREGDPWR